MIMEQRIDDMFPVGMRVLAVDDDPTCLMLLETLLRKCQYHVTTTSQAISALKMLRENKDRFDLVISDVHMPDMDGFKLLELVGLELDLPVIMLSAYGDNKLVMKGITHGACDYLLKPVRIEELKNIWQHVIRRKKFDPKDKKDGGKPQGVGSGEVEGTNLLKPGDQNEAKLNRKRKDQIGDEDDDDDDDEEHNENGNDDPSTQKKPRVVWSVDLHRKFVAAVNHLGIDKAVPKRILDLMDVEKLSRENVASHLQKYRLYLKRISCVASQQANMIAALGSSADSGAYMRMASFNGGFGNIQTIGAGSTPFQNSAAYGNLHTISSSRGVQLGQPQNSSSNSIILQGTPMSFEFNQLQKHNQGGGGATTNSLFNIVNNPMMVQGNLQDSQRRRDLQNQPFPIFAVNQLDANFERIDDNWVSAHSYASDLRAGVCSTSMNMMINNPHNTRVAVDHLRSQAASTSTSSIAGQNMNLMSKLEYPHSETRRNTMYDNNNINHNSNDPIYMQHNGCPQEVQRKRAHSSYSHSTTVDSLEDLASVVMMTKHV